MALSNGTPITSPNGASAHTPAAMTAFSSATATENQLASLWTRYESIKYNDMMKNALLEVREQWHDISKGEMAIR